MAMISMTEALDLLDDSNDWRRFQVSYEPKEFGDWKIEKFEIERMGINRLRILRDEGLDRDPGWGTFTRLLRRTDEDPREHAGVSDGWRLWMSDSRAEIMEHSPLFNVLWWSESTKPKRLLINGLGLGMAVHGALTFSHVEHIDVVEIDAGLVEFMRPYFDPDRVTFHVADALTIEWPRGTRWDYVWDDIWPTIDEDNLESMDALRRKYRHRCTWQKQWQRDGCLKVRRKNRQFAEALARGDFVECKRLDPYF
jgi:hypothetical protein